MFKSLQLALLVDGISIQLHDLKQLELACGTLKVPSLKVMSHHDLYVLANVKEETSDHVRHHFEAITQDIHHEDDSYKSEIEYTEQVKSYKTY